MPTSSALTEITRHFKAFLEQSGEASPKAGEARSQKDSSHVARARSNNNLQELAKQKIEQYVHSHLDHVLNFHRKPKGDLPGATVWKILANGRPDDREACGYNVLMKYPQIPKGTKIIHSASSTSSIMLIEHALMFAQKQGIKHVIAFSRPAGFYKWLRVNKVV